MPMAVAVASGKWRQLGDVLTLRMQRRSRSTKSASSCDGRSGISATPICSSICSAICLATSVAQIWGMSRSSQNTRANASGVISFSAS